MSRTRMTRLLHVAIAGVALCVLFVYAVLLPDYGHTIAQIEAELSHLYWPWLLFLMGTGVPLLAALVLAWRITTQIGQDRSFSHRNAADLKRISRLAYIDVLYFVVGLVVLSMVGTPLHPGAAIVALILIVGGFAIGIAAHALSYLVENAAKLQEDCDLTI